MNLLNFLQNYSYFVNQDAIMSLFFNLCQFLFYSFCMFYHLLYLIMFDNFRRKLERWSFVLFFDVNILWKLASWFFCISFFLDFY